MPLWNCRFHSQSFIEIIVYRLRARHVFVPFLDEERNPLGARSSSFANRGLAVRFSGRFGALSLPASTHCDRQHPGAVASQRLEVRLRVSFKADAYYVSRRFTAQVVHVDPGDVMPTIIFGSFACAPRRNFLPKSSSEKFLKEVAGTDHHPAGSPRTRVRSRLVSVFSERLQPAGAGCWMWRAAYRELARRSCRP